MPTQTTHKDILCVVPRKVSLSDAPPPCSLLAARDFYYCFLLVHKTSTGLHQTQRYCDRPSVDWPEYPVSKPIILLEPLQQVACITMEE